MDGSCPNVHRGWKFPKTPFFLRVQLELFPSKSHPSFIILNSIWLKWADWEVKHFFEIYRITKTSVSASFKQKNIRRIISFRKTFSFFLSELGNLSKFLSDIENTESKIFLSNRCVFLPDVCQLSSRKRANIGCLNVNFFHQIVANLP